MSESLTSKFVWHDLMATDAATSVAFFTELFGWRTEDKDMGPMGTYTMLFAGQRGIGGVVPLEGAEGIPAHFIGYVQVDDVDAAGDRAAQHGGAVCVPGTDIPGVGRFSVVTDPTGAVVSPFCSSHEPAADCESQEGEALIGTVCWNELLTPDPEVSRAFYGELFGWTGEDMDMGEMGTYTMLKSGETQIGAGMMKLPEGAETSRGHWLAYVAVENVDDSAKRVTELGGRIWHEPMDIPGIGRFAVAADPTGAMFAIFCR